MRDKNQRNQQRWCDRGLRCDGAKEGIRIAKGYLTDHTHIHRDTREIASEREESEKQTKRDDIRWGCDGIVKPKRDMIRRV